MRKLILLFLLVSIVQITFAQDQRVKKDKNPSPMIEEEVVEEAPPPPPRTISPSYKSKRTVKDPFQYYNNYGMIKRLYPNPNGFYFSLKNGKTTMNPRQGYYIIPIEHKNYDVLVKVLLMSVEKGVTLKVRTEPELNDQGHAIVQYLVIDL